MNLPFRYCPTCSANIGHVSALLRLIGVGGHVCKPWGPWSVDADGRVRTEKDRRVELRAEGVRDDVQ